MIRTLEEAASILQYDSHIALDLETGGYSPWQDDIHIITMYGENSKTPVVLHYPRGKRVPTKVLRWLETFDEITTHNGTMFDILFLANAGMRWTEVKWYDTMVGELAVITANRRNVKVNLADSLKRRAGKVIDKTINHESWGNDYLDARQLEYLTGDISYLLEMRDEQFSRAAEHPDMLRNLDFEMSIIPAVVQMELNGLPVSLPRLRSFLALQEEIATRNHRLLEELLGLEILLVAPKNAEERRRAAGKMLITSPQQVKTTLQSVFGAEAFSDTTAETFQNYLIFGGKIAEVSQAMLDFRHADRREKMYSPEWQQKNVIDHGGMNTRLHGKFWQIGTETGRFSSSHPNLQQIPRDMRAVFEVYGDEVIGSTDYAGIEVRVAAGLADDKVMIEVFRNGEDIHTVVAAAGFSIDVSDVTKEQRQIAKAMSFTLLFGGGAETFRAYATARGSTITLEQAELAVERFFERFQGISDMRQSAEWKAKHMRAVTLVYPTGLKRVLFNESLRASVILNNIVQGTAAAGLKYALLECLNDGLTKYISAVVHDEIVYTARPSEIIEVRDGIERAMIRGMERAMVDCVSVPIEVESEYGQSWAGDESTKHVRTGSS